MLSSESIRVFDTTFTVFAYQCFCGQKTKLLKLENDCRPYWEMSPVFVY